MLQPRSRWKQRRAGEPLAPRPAAGPSRRLSSPCLDSHQEALVEGFKHHDMLTTGQNTTAKPAHPLVTDRIADNGKCFLSDPIGRGDVVGANWVAIIDFGARHEAVDFDRMSALDLDFFEFV